MTKNTSKEGIYKRSAVDHSFAAPLFWKKSKNYINNKQGGEYTYSHSQNIFKMRKLLYGRTVRPTDHGVHGQYFRHGLLIVRF